MPETNFSISTFSVINFVPNIYFLKILLKKDFKFGFQFQYLTITFLTDMM